MEQTTEIGGARDGPQETTTDDRALITAVLNAVDAGLEARDAAATVAPFAPGAVIYDLAPPLAHGIDEDGMREWLDTWEGPVTREARDFEISVEGGLAFAHGLYKVNARTRQGHAASWWMRATVCLRRDGEWRVVHEHTSVPFHMDGSFRAATDLQP